MWEWSNRTLERPKQAPAKSLVASYSDIYTARKPQKTPHQSETEETLEKLSEFLKKNQLGNISLIETPYKPQTLWELHEIYRQYQTARKIFIRRLGHNLKKLCPDSGLKENDILLLQQGLLPENYNTHLKIPFDFGGKVDMENFSLIKTHPTHILLHQIIDYQVERGTLLTKKKIFLPFFEGMVYHG